MSESFKVPPTQPDNDFGVVIGRNLNGLVLCLIAYFFFCSSVMLGHNVLGIRAYLLILRDKIGKVNLLKIPFGICKSYLNFAFLYAL